MCTVSWIRGESGYQLFSNRDEKLTRQPSTAAQVLSRDGIRYVAPIDGDHGGTWLAANEYGLTLSLLNGYGPAQGVTSRGLLLLDWIALRTPAEVAACFGQQSLQAFSPLTVIALQAGNPVVVLSWDGNRKACRQDHASEGVMSSSSFDHFGVAQTRRAEFAGLRARAGALGTGHLLGFHRSHLPGRGPYSPCMHRADAQTVSFSWITATQSHIDLFHSPGPPCSSLAGHSQTIALRQEGWTCRPCC